MINIDFRFIIADFWNIQDNRTIAIILWLPIIIVLVCLTIGFITKVDYFAFGITKTVSVLIPLLALMLTGITFLTSWNSNSELREYNTKRILRGKILSLYEYMIINFFYVIVLDILLLFSYVVAGLFSIISCFEWLLVMNAIFSFFVVHILLVMLINIGDLFFVLTKKQKISSKYTVKLFCVFSKRNFEQKNYF